MRKKKKKINEMEILYSKVQFDTLRDSRMIFHCYFYFFFKIYINKWWGESVPIPKANVVLVPKKRWCSGGFSLSLSSDQIYIYIYVYWFFLYLFWILSSYYEVLCFFSFFELLGWNYHVYIYKSILIMKLIVPCLGDSIFLSKYNHAALFAMC